MKLLVACERSNVVRDAFASLGWDAWSCDLQDAANGGKHYKGDVRDILFDEWDLVIAHPPCTYLTVTGNRWFNPEYAETYPTRRQDRRDAIQFFMLFTKLQVPYAIENPVGIMSRVWRKPNQIIQPYEFGHVEAKKTCLWLQGLPRLRPTKIVKPEYTTFESGKRMATWYANAWKNDDRMNIRSQTFQGVADAMASQWTASLEKQTRKLYPVQMSIWS